MRRHHLHVEEPELAQPQPLHHPREGDLRGPRAPVEHRLAGEERSDREAVEASGQLVAVLEKDLGYGTIRDLDEAPKGLVDRLRHYFLSYKQIPGAGPRKVEISEVYGRDEAVEVLRRSIADYRKSFGAPEERLRRLQALLGEG